MPPVNLLIKPASGRCNMRCRYCFYFDELQSQPDGAGRPMSPDTLELVVKRALEAATDRCTFGFQGGEPTLVGLDFYRHLVALQRKYNVRRIPIDNTIQTNGLLLDDAWASFLAEHNFLVGISLDGTQLLHDANRLDRRKEGTHARVMEAVARLQRRHVNFNVLTVVTRELAGEAEAVYRFFLEHGLVYQQYIPCLDPLEHQRGAEPYSLTPQAYAQFLKALFDLWYADTMAGRFVYIRFFENLIAILSGQQPECCSMFGSCSQQFAIESDGSTYPCDFYMLPPYRLGNIRTDSLAALDQRRNQLGFIQRSARHPAQCRQCQWYPLCRNGCMRDRLQSGPEAGTNYFCPAYREFFAYAARRLLYCAHPA